MQLMDCVNERNAWLRTKNVHEALFVLMLLGGKVGERWEGKIYGSG